MPEGAREAWSLGPRGHDSPLVVGPGDEIAPVEAEAKRCGVQGVKPPGRGMQRGRKAPLPR